MVLDVIARSLPGGSGEVAYAPTRKRKAQRFRGRGRRTAAFLSPKPSFFASCQQDQRGRIGQNSEVLHPREL